MSKSPRTAKIVDQGALKRFRTEIPNTIVKGIRGRGLSLPARWLYVYLKSVAGETGECWQNTTTLAAGAQLGRGTIASAKAELVAKKLIALEAGHRGIHETDRIYILDIWDENMCEFSAISRSGDELGTEADVLVTPSQEAERVQEVNPAVHHMNAAVQEVNPAVHHMNALIRKKKEPNEEEPNEESCWGGAETNASAPPPAAPVPGAATPAQKIHPLAADDWLWLLLQDYTPTIDATKLNDDAWWNAVSQPLEAVFSQAWLNAELGKMTCYLLENKAKRPASVPGWKRFVRAWLVRTYEQQRRQTPGRKPYATATRRQGARD